MAVRSSATGQSYSSTAGLPTSVYTITCWAYLTTDRNAISGIWGIAGTIETGLLTNADGTTLRVNNETYGAFGSLAMSVGVWYKLAVVWNGTAVSFYHAPAGSALTVESGTLNNLTNANTWRIGSGWSTTDWWNGRIAAFKQWNVALTTAEVTQELEFYTPQRTAGLQRWHPFVNAETTDYSGLSRSLSGGTGATAESGPPIAWRPHPALLTIPWDPTTLVWYAIYDTTSGALISTGTDLPSPLPSGQGSKSYLGGQPDLSIYEWDTTARDFVLRSGDVLIDRVADLVADGTLTTAWASLSGPDNTAMQNRIGQMLGPYRYRFSSQDVDLT